MKKFIEKWHYVGLLLLMLLPFAAVSCGSDDDESYKAVSVKDVVGKTFTQTVKLDGITLSNCEFTLEEVPADATKLKLTVKGTDIPADYELQGVEVNTYQTGLGLHISANYTKEKVTDGTKFTYTYNIAGACSNIGDGKLYFDLNLTVDKAKTTTE